MSQLKRVDVLDILGRVPVKPSKDLLNKNIYDKNILITGAGGSIEKELSKQIAQLTPKKIIILDHLEFSLYKINNELKKITDMKLY